MVAVFAIAGIVFIFQSFAANANLPGDVNSDNKVNLTDLSQLLSKWNTTDSNTDVNSDGKVNLQDLSLLLSNWNKTYTPGTPPPTTPPPTTPPPANGSFAGPLKAGPTNRYLVDQNNKPFFFTADTCWTCLTRLSVADAKQYIDLRKAQGFNVMMTNIVAFSRTASGPHGTPFTNGNMSQPIESYFQAIDQIVDYAATQNMVVYIGTLWTGDNGGKYGGSLPSNSEFESYGSYLGNRYKNKNNIVWFVGGDDTPGRNFSQISAMANKLKAASPNQLISYHSDSKYSAASGQGWLGFNSFQWNSNSPPYSYADVREVLGWGNKPAFDMEPSYEPKACCGGDQDTSEQENRRSGWWAALSGAMGIAYGGPEGAWNMGAASGNKIDTNAINRNGARHSGNIQKILSPLNWHLLQPDWNNETVTGGRGSYGSTNYVAAGRASDGSLIVAYTPQGTTLTVNLSKLSGSALAQWYDVTTGNPIGSAETVSNSGTKTFSTGTDSVLVIKR